MNKEKVIPEKKVSHKKSSKKREDSKVADFPKLNPFMTSDNRQASRQCETKVCHNPPARSNSIEATKKAKDKRKKSSEYSTSFVNTASGKNMVRNASDQFSHIKPLKTQPSIATVEKLKMLKLAQKG